MSETTRREAAERDRAEDEAHRRGEALNRAGNREARLRERVEELEGALREIREVADGDPWAHVNMFGAGGERDEMAAIARRALNTGESE